MSALVVCLNLKRPPGIRYLNDHDPDMLWMMDRFRIPILSMEIVTSQRICHGTVMELWMLNVTLSCYHVF